MANINLLEELPFFKLTDFALANLFMSDKNNLLENLYDMGLKSIIKKKVNPLQQQTLEESDCKYYDIEEFNRMKISNKQSLSIRTCVVFLEMLGN